MQSWRTVRCGPQRLVRRRRWRRSFVLVTCVTCLRGTVLGRSVGPQDLGFSEVLGIVLSVGRPTATYRRHSEIGGGPSVPAVPAENLRCASGAPLEAILRRRMPSFGVEWGSSRDEDRMRKDYYFR